MKFRPFIPLLLYVYPIELLHIPKILCLIDCKRLLLLQRPAVTIFMMQSSRPLVFAFPEDENASGDKEDQGHDAEG